MLKHPRLTFLYQFLAEGIIAFLLILPFTFNHYEPHHYWAYLVVIALIGLCFLLLETPNRSVSYFVIVVPVGFVLLYVFQFPIGFIIVFPFVFIWRYAKIRSYNRTEQEALYLHALDNRYHKNKEKIYLHVTMVLSIITAIYSKEMFAIYYAFLQLIILLTGTLISRMAIIDKEEREHIHLNAILPLPLIMIFGSVITLFVFNPFRQIVYYIWLGIQSAFIYVGGTVVRIIVFLIPNIENLKAEETDRGPVGLGAIQGMIKNLLPEKDQTGIDEVILIVAVIFIMIGTIIFLIVRALKGKGERVQIKTEQTVNYHLIDKREPKKVGLFEQILNRLIRKPADPVRHLVYEFERKADKKDYGRYSFESLEEWFRRLKVDVNMKTYQKVRYGNIDVSDGEVTKLKQQLEEIEQKFN